MVAHSIKKNSNEITVVMEICDKFIELFPFFKTSSEAGVQKLINISSTTFGKNKVSIKKYEAQSTMKENGQILKKFNA